MARFLTIVALASAVFGGETDVEGLIEKLGSPDARVRFAAMEEAKSLDEEGRFALTARIPTLPPEVGTRIWRGLAGNLTHDPSYRVAALRFDPNPAQAAERTKPDAELLVPRLAELPPERRMYALTPSVIDAADQAWQTAPPPQDGAADPILSLATHPSARVRSALAGCLHVAESHVARGVLTSLSHDPAAVVRQAAARSLEWAGGRRKDVLRSALPFLTDRSAGVRRDVVCRLQEVSSPIAAWALYGRLWDPDPEVRESAAQWFLLRPEPWALPLAIRGLGGEQEYRLWEALEYREGDGLPAAIAIADALPRLPRVTLPGAISLLESLSRKGGCPGPAYVPIIPHGARIECEPAHETDGALLDGYVNGVHYDWNDGTVTPRSDGAVAGGTRGVVRCPEGSHVVAIAFDSLSDGPSRVFAIEVSDEGERYTAVGEFRVEENACADTPIPLGRRARAIRWRQSSREEEGSDLFGWLTSEVRLYDGPEDPIAAWAAWARSVRDGTYVVPAFDAADPAAHVDRARRLQTMHDFKAAEEDLAVAVALAPGDPVLRYHHGCALRSLGRHADAALEFDEATGAEFLGDEAWYRLACEQAILGETELALESLARAAYESGLVPSRARTDPDFRSLRGDPRFEEAIQRGGR